MNIEEAKSRVREAEHIIEDVLNNLIEDLGIQVTDLKLTSMDISTLGKFKVKAKVDLEVKL